MLVACKVQVEGGRIAINPTRSTADDVAEASTLADARIAPDDQKGECAFGERACIAPKFGEIGLSYNCRFDRDLDADGP